MGFEYDDTGAETARQRGVAPRALSMVVKVRPKPKARPRASKHGHMYTDKATRDYEKLIGDEWRKQNPGEAPLVGALQVKLVFTFKRPKSHFNSKGKLKPQAPERFLQTPDIDNLEKGVLDGLNKIAYADDKVIYSKLSTKTWGAIDGVFVACREMS